MSTASWFEAILLSTSLLLGNGIAEETIPTKITDLSASVEVSHVYSVEEPAISTRSLDHQCQKRFGLLQRCKNLLRKKQAHKEKVAVAPIVSQSPGKANPKFWQKIKNLFGRESQGMESEVSVIITSKTTPVARTPIALTPVFPEDPIIEMELEPIATDTLLDISHSVVESEEPSPRLAHAEDYRWVQGRLQQVHTGGGVWVVRYAPLDQTDQFGGSVVLERDNRIAEFSEGDFVRVRGEVLSKRSSRFLRGPLYRLDKITLVERGSQSNLR